MLPTQTKALLEIIMKIEFQLSPIFYHLKAEQISIQISGLDAHTSAYMMVTVDLNALIS
jgi:hypothetical protein